MVSFGCKRENAEYNLSSGLAQNERFALVKPYGEGPPLEWGFQFWLEGSNCGKASNVSPSSVSGSRTWGAHHPAPAPSDPPCWKRCGTVSTVQCAVHVPHCVPQVGAVSVQNQRFALVKPYGWPPPRSFLATREKARNVPFRQI